MKIKSFFSSLISLIKTDKSQYCITTDHDKFLYKWNFLTNSFQRLEVSNTEVSNTAISNTFVSNTKVSNTAVLTHSIPFDSILFNIQYEIAIDRIILDNYINSIINLSPFKHSFPIGLFIDDDFNSVIDCLHFRKIIIFNIYAILQKPKYLMTDKEIGLFNFYNHILKLFILKDFEKIEYIPILTLGLIFPEYDLNLTSLYQVIKSIKKLTMNDVNDLSIQEKYVLTILTFDLISKKNKGFSKKTINLK